MTVIKSFALTCGSEIYVPFIAGRGTVFNTVRQGVVNEKIRQWMRWRMASTVLVGVVCVFFLYAVLVAVFRPEDDRPDAGIRSPLVVAETIYVVGDSYTGGSTEGGRGPKGWPRLLNASLNRNDQNIRYLIEEVGVAGSGYVNTGPGDTTFREIAQDLVTTSGRVVVVFGSRNDVGLDIRTAARLTYQSIRELDPAAQLVVIGPTWKDPDVPVEILTLRDVLSSETLQAGGTFVDPIAGQWFFGDSSEYLAADGVEPTDEGHRYLSKMIEPHIRLALDGSR